MNRTLDLRFRKEQNREGERVYWVLAGSMRRCLPDCKVIIGDRDLQKWLTKRKFRDGDEYRLRSSWEMMKIGDQYEGKIAIEISRLPDFS